MENTNENKEMTAQESLSLITETLNKSRNDITRQSGKFFLLWGTLLTIFSLLVYLLWKTTNEDDWNLLWFGLPVIGIVLERFLRKRDTTERVKNDVSRIVGGIWAAFGIFACSLSAFTIIYTNMGSGLFGPIAAAISMTAGIIILFGMAEYITGVALKNWVIKVAGFITGIGGLAIHYISGSSIEQMFIFTFAGLVLVATGLIIKLQDK